MPALRVHGLAQLERGQGPHGLHEAVGDHAGGVHAGLQAVGGEQLGGAGAQPGREPVLAHGEHPRVATGLEVAGGGGGGALQSLGRFLGSGEEGHVEHGPGDVGRGDVHLGQVQHLARRAVPGEEAPSAEELGVGLENFVDGHAVLQVRGPPSLSVSRDGLSTKTQVQSCLPGHQEALEFRGQSR